MPGRRQRAAEKLIPQQHKSYLTDQDARDIVARHFSQIINREARKRLNKSVKSIAGLETEGIRFVRYGNLDGQPTIGSVNILENGQFVYEPQPDWTGTDTFSFQITDNRLLRLDLVFEVQ